MFQLNFITQVSNPNVTSGNVCPWGVPTFFKKTSGPVDPNSRWCWMLVSKRSQVAVENGLDVKESLFLLLDAVEHVLVMGVGTGMLFG